MTPDIVIEVQEEQELSTSPVLETILSASWLFEVASKVTSARLSATVKW
jgi:hypothetical protein